MKLLIKIAVYNSSVNPAFEVITYCKDVTFSFCHQTAIAALLNLLIYTIAHKETDAAKDSLRSGE